MKLLLTGAFNYSDEQLEKIKKLGYDVTYILDERLELKIDVSSFEIIVCNSLFLYNDIAKFKKLRCIQLTSVGLDRLPMEYIKRNNIKVYKAKDVYSIPIAEWVILKTLEIYKKSRKFIKNQENKKWEKQRDIFELTDKTVSILGFGSVGNEIAKRFKAFGVNLIGVGRKELKSELLDEYYIIDDIDIVLKKSDIIIITLPLTDETRCLIGKDKFNKMKNNCVLINVSRGKILDEVELIKSIKNDKFMGVALDVFEEEPLDIDSELWNMSNVLITPHNSFKSDKTNDRLWKIILESVSNYRWDNIC